MLEIGKTVADGTSDQTTLHVAIAPSTAKSGTNGAITISPPLQEAPANTAPIILYRPGAMMRLAAADTARADSPANFSGFAFQAVEA